MSSGEITPSRAKQNYVHVGVVSSSLPTTVQIFKDLDTLCIRGIGSVQSYKGDRLSDLIVNARGFRQRLSAVGTAIHTELTSGYPLMNFSRFPRMTWYFAFGSTSDNIWTY